MPTEMGLPELSNIHRQLKVSEHELEEIANTRPPEGAEVTLAMRRVQEALMYVEKAQEKAKGQNRTA